MSKQTKLPERFPAKGWVRVKKGVQKEGDVMWYPDTKRLRVLGQGWGLGTPAGHYFGHTYRRIIPKRTQPGSHKFTVTAISRSSFTQSRRACETLLRRLIGGNNPDCITFKIGRGK